MERRVFALLLTLALLSQPCFAAAQQLETFEGGTWATQPVGQPLTSESAREIEGWSLSKGDTSTGGGFRLEPDPYHEGGTSLLVTRPGGWQSGSTLATKKFEPLSNTATVSFRYTTPQTFDGRGHYFSILGADGKRVANLGFNTASATGFTGKDWINRDYSIGAYACAFGMYFADAAGQNSLYLDQLPTAEDGRISYARLEYINYKFFIWEERYISLVFHFDTKMIDVYYDIEPIKEQEPVASVPFIDQTAETIGQVTLGTGSGGIKNMYYDDILITDGNDIPVKTVDYTVSNAIYTPDGETVSVSADVTKGSAESASVFAVAYNSAGLLVGISPIQTMTANLPFESNFTTNGDVAKVTILVWDSVFNAVPLSVATEATRYIPPPPPGPDAVNEDFQSGEWLNQTTGVALNNPMIFGSDPTKTYARGANVTINGWVLQGQDYKGGKFLLTNDPMTGATGTGLLVSMDANPDWRESGIAATKTFNPVNGTAEFSCRLVTDQADSNTGRNHYLQLKNGSKVIATFGGAYCGANLDTLDWNGNPLSLGQWNNYFGLHYAASFPGLEKEVQKYDLVDGKLPYIKLGSRAPKQTWYLKMLLHFDTQTIDVTFTSTPITAETPVTVTVPFRDACTQLDTLVLGGGSYGRGPLYWDDIKVTQFIEN